MKGLIFMYPYPGNPYPFRGPSGYPYSQPRTVGYSARSEGPSALPFKDYGPNPFAVNIEQAAKQNQAYRRALWTGKHLQVTLMSINPGEDIGLEIHPHLDQFIRIEDGQGQVMMGRQKSQLDFQQPVSRDFAFIIPAGTWHNLVNTGHVPIKLYSIYAPPQHPFGTVQQTRAEAESAERYVVEPPTFVYTVD
ncbi:cupin domain-containing protein [Sporolactobacillus sp. CPB3-1]|uniref:Cupin domain-containing protein n=1 Tax=Sporolactobacillus mangiferae TaxID=2940498 RepID=A0ABT0MAY0_9BACL|nr:cupin domain-containing protein [Sporolactobacillus mangiferae]MCL1632022.1 cupin domain-containing protein [Sporolactobacillus mangiferae]